MHVGPSGFLWREGPSTQISAAVIEMLSSITFPSQFGKQQVLSGWSANSSTSDALHQAWRYSSSLGWRQYDKSAGDFLAQACKIL